MIRKIRSALLLAGAAVPALALEQAAYDANGRLIALMAGGEELAVRSTVVAVLPNGKRVPLHTRVQDRGTRRGEGLQWTAAFALADGGRGRLELRSQEDGAAATVRYSSTVTAETPLEVSAIELVLDLPRALFLNGKVTAEGTDTVALAPSRPGTPVLLTGEAQSVRAENAAGTLALDITLDQRRRGEVVDRWDNLGRVFDLRVALAAGALPAGASGSATATLRLTQRAPEPAPVKIAVDTARPRYRFHGFGGNYCWNNQSPVAAYTVKNLKLGWARAEMKLLAFDRNRDNPPAEVRADMEMMRRFHQMGVPYVLSIWWLPERFYTDSYEKPRSAHFRLIKGEKWDELLELLSAYLAFAKREYGVEPDLFSFNESNIGVYVGQTPETHTEALKRIGAHFRKQGFKTKMLLGDATGPRDTHRFVLEAAADPVALSYVGAIGFHSWGGGTAEQYAAWGDVAEWLNLPLLVTELGVDAAAYSTRAWDSYHYGLREARMTQELLTHARPQGTQFWQFTNDYGLARDGQDGTVEPSARFWLMKHFTDLTPLQSEAVTVASSDPAVLVTAFRKGGSIAAHILNTGAARAATVEGLASGSWFAVETTESAHYQRRALNGGELRLPARSLVTVTNISQP